MKPIIFSLLLIICLSACTNYGKKAKSGNIEIYYKEGITKEQAQRTADLFYRSVKESGSDTKSRKSFQLAKPGDTVLLKMVADKKKMESAPEAALYAISELVSDSIFNGGPVNLILTDNKLNPYQTLVFNKAGKEDFGEKIRKGNIELYRNDVETETANQIASFLDGYMKPATVISFQLSKNSKDELVLKMVSDRDKVDGVTNKEISDLCTKISEQVLNGGPFVFQMTDDHFEALRTFTYPSDLNQ